MAMKYPGIDILLAGLFLSLALVFPIIFHALGMGGSFLPMFYPIVVAGYLISLPLALVVGVMAPLVSALSTGMPPFYPPVAFLMMFEGMVLVTFPAILHQKYHLNILMTLIFTLIMDRLAVLVFVVLIAKWLALPPGALGLVSVLKGIPGIIIMLFVIPPLVKRLNLKKKQLAIME